MTTKDAVDFLVNEMKQDPSYRVGWQSNIAMAFKDCAYQYKKKLNKRYLTGVDIHIIANDAAIFFLDQLGRKK